MTRIVSGKLIIEAEPPRECSACGRVAECRPYGVDGADVCFRCAMVNPDEARRQYQKRLDASEQVSMIVVGKSQEVS